MKKIKGRILEYFGSINPFRKGKKLYSIVKLKCPKCQEGNLFVPGNPYNLKTFDKMPDRCLNCNEDFVRESGFYWGAMMVSHATSTALSVIIHILIHPFYGWEIVPNITILIVVFILLVPVIFRNSRAIWINIFVDFNPSLCKSKVLP